MTNALNLAAPLTGFFVFLYFANTIVASLPIITF